MLQVETLLAMPPLLTPILLTDALFGLEIVE
jgi:hypothetical protein